MNENVSEYEAKRLRRIAENRLRLQDLNLPTLSENPSSSVKCAKRKREVKENSPEPPRRSSRHRQKQNLENELQQNSEPQIEWQGLEKVDKNEQIQGKHVETMLKHKWKQDAETLEVETKGAKWDQEAQAQEVKSSDWRLRRKLQAREEKRQRTLKRREERRARRLKEMKQLIKIKKRERKRRKKQKEDAKLAREVQKELERQQRVEDREQMREEDRLARQVAKQRVNDAKQHQLQQKYAGWNQNLEEIFKARRNMTRKREHEGNQTMYPVQRLNDLPFVRISDSMEASASKPLVLTPLLRVDVDLFHAFSLGKQFLPPGKKSALQGLCPGGYTLEFDDNVDFHVWQNTMTLFINGPTGRFYQSMFRERQHRGCNYVSFQWTRCRGITPSILWRLCRMQRGDNCLCAEESDSNAPQVPEKPESLLLFLQYPKGPYIYCGRLGYLGHHATPLEFSFQLLDINALNWSHIRTLLLSAD